MVEPAPLGILDSGVGGISVMKQIRRELPMEDLIYFADSAYCPYGDRTPAEVHHRTVVLADFLVSRGAKLVVVACNTASSASLNKLREVYEVPIIGMEPALKPAASITENKKVGILATGVTISGDRFGSLMERFANGIQVFSQACPGLVELVEAGEIDGSRVERMLTGYLDPLIEAGVDTIVLGCTHYPFLKPVIESLVGRNIRVIDTGRAVSRWVAQVLRESNLASPGKEPGTEKFFTTGDPETVGKVIRRLWNRNNIQLQQELI